jgi:hypothetical protein
MLLLKPTAIKAAAAGMVGGLALTLHNPLPHMLFAVPWLIWLMTNRDRRRVVPAIVAGYLPWVIVVGFGWYEFVNTFRDAPANGGAVSGSRGVLAAALKTLLGVFKIPGKTQLVDRLIALAKLWVWAAPALIPLAFVGFWRQRSNIHLRLLLISAALTFAGYMFVPLNQGHGWGFRYFHSAWLVLPVLAAAALTPHSASMSNAESPRAVHVVAYSQGAVLGGMLLVVPFLLWQVRGFITAHLAQLPVANHGTPRVVIINPAMGYYAWDLVQNDPFLRAPVIRMITHGRRQDEDMMARHFPELVRLSQSYRGTVWGYPDQDAVGAAAARR